MSTCTAVYGIFVTPRHLETAVAGLVSAGLSGSGLSLLMSDKGGLQDFHISGADNPSDTIVAGAEVGGVVGGLVGLLVGLGALVIPGAGPLVAAGPIMASLAGLGVGGALGGLVSGLVELGLPEYEAKLYDGRLRDGAVLLSVHCLTTGQITTAKDVLLANGAEDVASAGEEELDAAAIETPASY